MKKTAVTKDGVTVERASDKYKGHIFYDADGTGYKCLGYNPKLDDCIYRNLKTNVEVVGCMDGFYFNKPVVKHKKGATVNGGYEIVTQPMYNQLNEKIGTWYSIYKNGSIQTLYTKQIGSYTKHVDSVKTLEEAEKYLKELQSKPKTSKRDKELAEFVNVSYKKGANIKGWKYTIGGL